jgi:chemotaxis protein histidine kinase CheA
MAIMLSTHPRTRWTLSAPATRSDVAHEFGLDPAFGGRARDPLTATGRVLLTEHFVRQLRKKLDDQEQILALLGQSTSWALEMLYKELHSVRAAATLLKQHNLASVAARGEVLVQLLKHGLVNYEMRHQELLADTLHILRGILDRIERDGSDQRCFSTARTALCLYAAAEPTTQYYEASHLPRQSAL